MRVPGLDEGRLLAVDLTSGRSERRDVPAAYRAAYLGGAGLAARLLWDHQPWTREPLAPEQPLIFAAGLLTGSNAPECGRHVVVGRSPATGMWGESNAGGKWGAELRFAGVDVVVVTGRARKPTYLTVRDGDAELRDASGLWGRDTYETQEALRKELGDAKTRVSCIGRGGEWGAHYASIMNDEGRAAGRTGLGWLMGAKNLKAIAVRGSRLDVPLARKDEFNAVAKQAHGALKQETLTEILSQTGTMGYIDMAMEFGDAPSRYWRSGREDVDGLGANVVNAQHLEGPYHCYKCGIGCGRITKFHWASEGKSGGKLKVGDTVVDGPEYESTVGFGPLVGNRSLDVVGLAHHLCNVYGLDVISCSGSVAFAFLLFEQGKVTERDVGFPLRWGDGDAVLRLVEMVGRGEGFGKVVGEGVERMGRRYRAERDAVHVHGLEVPYHDPRAFHGMAVAYATAPRGADHNQCEMYQVDIGWSAPEYGVEAGDRFASGGKARVAARVQDYIALKNNLVMCQFANPPPEMLRSLLEHATGEAWTYDSMMTAGERAFTLRRTLNLKFGLRTGVENDVSAYPAALTRPLPEGGTEGRVPDLRRQLVDYYDHRAWDPATGAPEPATLRRLGLGVT